MKNSKSLWRALLFFVLIAALCGSFALPAVDMPVSAAPQFAPSTTVVISQVYGGGGNSGATYKNDFIELHNVGSTPVSLNGWSVQYTGSTGITWQVTPLTNFSIAAGQYYLIQESAGTGGTVDLPTPDANGSIVMAATTGKVALVNTTNALSGSCPTDASIVDLIGFGSGTNCFETALAPTPSNTTADIRNSNSCTDTDNNANDFTAGTPNPRNTSNPAISCTKVTDVNSSTGDGIYTTGKTIAIEVTFSSAVNVTGSPTLLLETGSIDRTASYVPGSSGTNSLTFNYTVMAGDLSTDLDYVSTDSLKLNGGTITDTVGDVNLALPTPGSPGSLGANRNIVIDDGFPPTATITKASGQAGTTSSLPINFSVVFSEAIDSSTFTVDDIKQGAGATATGITWNILPSSDSKNFTLRATAVTGAGTLIPSIPAGTVKDLAGNDNTVSTSTDIVTYNNSVSGSNVVISEFRTRGPDGANDEFIELYNPTFYALNISGWKISASSSTGTTKTTKATIPSSTLLQSGQYYLVINNNSSGGYSIASVTGNLTYTQGIADDGGIALLRADDTVVDQVGMSSTTVYKEGTPLAKLSTDTDQSYERKIGGASDSCQDTNNNANDFFTAPSDPHNLSTPLSRCGTKLTLRSSFTTITIPYSVKINTNVTIQVKVTGGTPTPTGKVVVTVTGTTLTCTATLNTSGIGSCKIKFTTLGSKTIVAVYLGDSAHAGSMVTGSLYVSTSTTSYNTPTPVPPPPPQLVVINEFVPRPGSDWNHDGVVNTGDEFIELLNHGTVDVNLSGWRLDDEVNVGSNPYSLPAKTIKPGERIVFFGSDTGIHLDDGGDAVRLLKPNGQLIDAYNYTIARYPDESFCRLPDNGGADDWNQFCFPTPGTQNSLSGNFVSPPTNGFEQQSCIVSDTLPQGFVQAECDPFGNNIWNPEFWNRTGWYDEKDLPSSDGKHPVFAD